MLARLFNPVKRAAAAALPPAATAAASPAPPAEDLSVYSMIAVIAGRHCLAYQGTDCTICVDRCPVPGALVLEQGLPRVVPDLCTGCNVCHGVCPAPGQAVRLVPRPPGLPPPPAAKLPPARSPFPVLPPRTPPGQG